MTKKLSKRHIDALRLIRDGQDSLVPETVGRWLFDHFFITRNRRDDLLKRPHLLTPLAHLALCDTGIVYDQPAPSHHCAPQISLCRRNMPCTLVMRRKHPRFLRLSSSFNRLSALHSGADPAGASSASRTMASTTTTKCSLAADASCLSRKRT